MAAARVAGPLSLLLAVALTACAAAPRHVVAPFRRPDVPAREARQPVRHVGTAAPSARPRPDRTGLTAAQKEKLFRRFVAFQNQQAAAR